MRATAPKAQRTGAGDARRLRDAIRALVRRFAISERADVACCGMTVAQAATLETLATEGPMRLGDLGARLGIAPSTLTRNLLRLEERGLVKRTGERGDGRSFRAALTPSGVRAADDVLKQDLAFAASILERLPAETRRDTLAGVEGLLVAVRDATDSCCPGAFDHLMTGIPRGGIALRRRTS
jgi:DNA-binding MarR family transcriptional regulator